MTFTRLCAIVAAFVAAPVLWAGAAMAQDQGTPEEAQAMAERAAALYQEVGAEAAFEAFTNSPDFHDRDLYVFAIDSSGIMAAHGTNQALVGRDQSNMRDPTGYAFNQDLMQIEDTGWIEYHWQNPASGNVEPKRSYVINVGDYWIGCGAYVN